MYFQQHTLLDFWKICQIYVKQSHLNSYILRFTVHFIPVQYVFHLASAEIEFLKDCAGYAPKKQNTARAAPVDSESLWGRWRRLPVCRGNSWSEPVDSKVHSSEIHSRGKDRDPVVAELTTSESTTKCGISSAKSSTRTERAKRDGGTGHLTYPWPRVSLCHHRSDECREVQWILGPSKVEPRP